ncbi:MAG: PAS domain S-box protein [Bernardetiaceae bacterium]
MPNATILCVDDEPLVTQSIRIQLERQFGETYTIETAESGEEALEIVEDILAEGEELPIVISDQIMPGMLGDELLVRINALSPETLKIMLTGQADTIAVGKAINDAQLYRYLAKPWTEEELVFSVREALHKYDTAKQLKAQEDQLRRYNEELEIKIAKRTAELEKSFEKLKEQQASLAASETKLRGILDSTTDNNVLLSTDLRILSFNRMAAQNMQHFFGRKPQLNEDFSQYLLPYTAEQFMSYFREALAGEQARLEFPLKIESRAVWFEFSYYPVKNDAGEVVAVSFNTVNINKRKRAEQALKASEEKLQSILDEVTDVIWSINLPDYRLLFISPSVEKLSGIAAQDWLNGRMTIFDWVDTSDRSILEEMKQQLIQTGKAQSEYRIPTRSGEDIWILNKSKIIFDKSNKPLRIDGVISDITAIKQEEAYKAHVAARTKIHNDIISQLNALDVEAFADMDEVYRFVSVLATNGLDAERCSIWHFQAEQQQLLCQTLYDVKDAQVSVISKLLTANEYPTYFEAIQRESVIIIGDAYGDPITYELLEDYLLPCGIRAMLDTPIYHNGKLFGVLCGESYRKKDWLAEDIRFANSLSDFLSLCMQNMERRQTREELRLVSEKTQILLQKIQSSINYANRIQQAIIPKENQMQQHLDCFVFFRPRDVVSGDFYWFTKKGDTTLLAVADCTGHGVPGAFMTIIATNILNQIVNDYGIFKPDEILNIMPVLLGRALRSSESKVSDGLDIALLTIEKSTQSDTKCTLTYAGAKNPLYLVEDGELSVLQADKVAIFGRDDENFRYQKQVFTLKAQREYMIYLCSDGYQDQFGGTKDSKFMKRRLRELFKRISVLSLNEQKAQVADTFDAWKGNAEQIDDVLVVGLRF